MTTSPLSLATPAASSAFACAAPPPAFPFAALQGQPALRLALLLAAIDPALGGVLIAGPRGSAKSTAARALAELLPGAAFVTLPLGASLEHLVGTLDLGEAFAGHALRFSPGLLARADGGVLYVDEVNLLDDRLVDALLDAAASGLHTVERDGISHTHAARFALVGTMNPEEGELRPQLLDRFGLCVQLEPVLDLDARREIARQRLAFDADPAAFRARHAAAQAALVERLAAARTRLAAWPLEALDGIAAEVAERCLASGAEGVRADLAMLRAARALAAWDEATEVGSDQVQRVAELVLQHRRREREPASGPAPHNPSPAPARAGQPPGKQTIEHATEQTDGRADGQTDGQAEGESSGQAGGRAGEPAAGPAAGQAAAFASAPSAARDAAAGAEGDWGALPPEPTGFERVKLLRPWPEEAAAEKKA